MIQGGCPDGTGMGGPGYSIKGEFAQNGFANNLVHDRGVLSMARAMHPNSAGSQFFIMVEQAPHLDGQYASFGKVIEGMEVALSLIHIFDLIDWCSDMLYKEGYEDIELMTEALYHINCDYLLSDYLQWPMYDTCLLYTSLQRDYETLWEPLSDLLKKLSAVVEL